MRVDRRLLVDLLRDESVRSISRRYFVSNGFDGTLSSVGVVVGTYLSGVQDGGVVVHIGVGAAVGLCTSGVWSVWEIERAEQRAELLAVERALLADLDETRFQRVKSSARAIHAVASGLGPLIGVLTPLTPFALAGSYLTPTQATAVGVVLGCGLLFAFGAYLGSISRQRWYVAGLRMGLAGVLVAAVNVFLTG